MDNRSKQNGVSLDKYEISHDLMCHPWGHLPKRTLDLIYLKAQLYINTKVEIKEIDPKTKGKYNENDTQEVLDI